MRYLCFGRHCSVILCRQNLSGCYLWNVKCMALIFCECVIS